MEFKTILIEIKYFKTLIVVEIKLFIKKMNKRIVLVEDLVTSRKISQNEKQRKIHKEIKQVEDGCENVLDTTGKLVHITKVALVTGKGMGQF